MKAQLSVIALAFIALLGFGALTHVSAQMGAQVFPQAQPNFSGELGGKALTDTTGPVQLGGACSGGLSGDVCIPQGQSLVLDSDGNSSLGCTGDNDCRWRSNGVDTIRINFGTQVQINGSLSLIGGRGLVPAAQTSNPCAATSNWPEGSILWNSTSKIHCYCPGGGAAALKTSDDTACFP